MGRGYAYNLERRKRLKAQGLCITCGKEKPVDKVRCGRCLALCRGAAAKHRTANRKQFNTQCREARKRIKVRVFEHYGVVCRCCGESNLAFLTLDHSLNNGKAARKIVGLGSSFYGWLNRHNFPDNLGLRVLCFNCNCGRAANGGI